MLMSLSESRLARSICSQFRERLKASHDQFAASLRHLEAMHSGRLERTEEQRLKVKAIYVFCIVKSIFLVMFLSIHLYKYTLYDQNLINVQ